MHSNTPWIRYFLDLNSPGVNPLIFAEFFVTDLVGILFLVGFKETKASGSFSIPTRMVMESGKSTKDLFAHQYQILESVLTPANIKQPHKELWPISEGISLSI